MNHDTFQRRIDALKERRSYGVGIGIITGCYIIGALMEMSNDDWASGFSVLGALIWGYILREYVR